MPQLAKKQLKRELETSLHSLGDVCCICTAVLVSPESSPVHSPGHGPVQSPAFTESQKFP